MRLYLLTLGTVVATGAPVPAYLIETDDGRRVLVDTGYSRSAPDKGPIRVAPGQAIDRQLAALGVPLDGIQYVVCSHLDPDHAGNHDLFPAAEFVIQRDHLELARSGGMPRLGLARAAWDRPELRYRQITGDAVLLPGIELIRSSGHITGHQSVLVRLPLSGPVLLAVDAIPTLHALDPDERPIYPFDTDEPEVRASTRRLVKLAEAEDARIICGHDAEQWSGLPAPPDYLD
jgi:N-acyl homoserine lactone hydrolase